MEEQEANLAIFPKREQKGRKKGKKKRRVLEDLELDFVRLDSEKDQSSLKPSACFEVLFLRDL